jgi:predicted nuclease with TOPRIM domain
MSGPNEWLNRTKSAVNDVVSAVERSETALSYLDATEHEEIDDAAERVSGERDELRDEVETLRERVKELEAEVAGLESELRLAHGTD